jgi:gamma-glutamylcyclotransferase (GGCT)/AIG2-like uncharacterized protein YtfP
MAEAEIGPEARFIGPARLDGFELGFRRRSVRWGGGAADIVPAAGGVVWGALYELPAVALDALDVKEGAGFAYRRREVVVDLDGRERSAVAYDVIDKEPVDVPPTSEYLALVVGAARARGLPEGYIATIGRLRGL